MGCLQCGRPSPTAYCDDCAPPARTPEQDLAEQERRRKARWVRLAVREATQGWKDIPRKSTAEVH